MTQEKSEVKLSVSDKIWNDLKDQELPLFGIPGKNVSDYAERVDITPSKLFLRLRAPAALPMLEDLFGKKYVFEMGVMYLEVSNKV